MNADILTTLSQYTYKKTVQRFPMIFADDCDILYKNSADYNGNFIYDHKLVKIINGYITYNICDNIYIMSEWNIYKNPNNKNYMIIIGNNNVYFRYFMNPYTINYIIEEIQDNREQYLSRLSDCEGMIWELNSPITLRIYDPELLDKDRFIYDMIVANSGNYSLVVKKNMDMNYIIWRNNHNNDIYYEKYRDADFHHNLIYEKYSSYKYYLEYYHLGECHIIYNNKVNKWISQLHTTRK